MRRGDICSAGCGAVWLPGDDEWPIWDGGCDQPVCLSCVRALELVVGEGEFHCPACVVKINHDAEVVEQTKKKWKTMSKKERKKAQQQERLQAMHTKRAAAKRGRSLDEPIPSNDSSPEPLAPHVFDEGGADEGGGEDCRIPTGLHGCQRKSPPETTTTGYREPRRASTPLFFLLCW